MVQIKLVEASRQRMQLISSERLGSKNILKDGSNKDSPGFWRKFLKGSKLAAHPAEDCILIYSGRWVDQRLLLVQELVKKLSCTE